MLWRIFLAHINFIFPPLCARMNKLHSNNNNSFRSSLEVKKKKTRTMFNHHQLGTLEATFQQSPYPDAFTRKELAIGLGLDEIQVQVWFQNRRARWRNKLMRQQKESKLHYVHTSGGSSL